jgi:hypothetical protein
LRIHHHRVARPGLESERVGAGTGLGKCVRTHGVAREFRQVTCLLVVIAVSRDRIVRERVLDVDENGRRCVDAADRLDCERDHHQASAGAAVLLVDLDPHEPELERGADEHGVKVRRLLHVGHPGAHLCFRESRDGVLEQELVRREGGQRRDRRREFPDVAHGSALIIGGSPR